MAYSKVKVLPGRRICGHSPVQMVGSRWFFFLVFLPIYHPPVTFLYSSLSHSALFKPHQALCFFLRQAVSNPLELKLQAQPDKF
jgi:hypothetical protein